MTYAKTFSIGRNLEVNRIGFGAVRITGPQIQGLPDNPQNSIDLVRRAVELGVTFIDRFPVDITHEFLARAQREGNVRHLGLSEVSVEDIKKAQEFFEVTTVQNKYAVDNREWEPVLDYCKEQGIGFIPWFPIGGGEMKGDDILQEIANAHGSTARNIALAWLLHHADNILLIPATSSLGHLEENMTVGEIELTEDDLSALDAIDY